MSWRGLAASCRPANADRSALAGFAGRAPRAAFPDRSGPALAERLLLAVCRSRSLGSSSYAERAPRGPPVPIARVRFLRRAGAPPTWSRSLGTRQRGTASPRPALIAQNSSSRGRLRRATGRLLACPHLGTRHLPREPAANRGLPLSAAPRESPPGPVPVPGDKEISSGRSARPTRAFPQQFRRVSRSTGQSTGGARLSPGNRSLSTASSTGTSTATVRTVHHPDTRAADARGWPTPAGGRPPSGPGAGAPHRPAAGPLPATGRPPRVAGPERTGSRRTPSAGSRSASRNRPTPAGGCPGADPEPAHAVGRQPVRFPQPADPRGWLPRSGPATGVRHRPAAGPPRAPGGSGRRLAQSASKGSCRPASAGGQPSR
jgi:hypothetical protein